MTYKNSLVLFLTVLVLENFCVYGSVILNYENKLTNNLGLNNISDKQFFGENEEKKLEQEIFQELNHLSLRKQREIFDDLEKQREQLNSTRKNLILSEPESLSPVNFEELKYIQKTIKSSNSSLPSIRNKRTLNFLLSLVARAMGYTLSPNPDAEWIPRQKPQLPPCPSTPPPCTPTTPAPNPLPCTMAPTVPPCQSLTTIQVATIPPNQIDANTISYPYRPARTIPLLNFSPLPQNIRVPYPPLFQPPAQRTPCVSTPSPPCGTTPAPPPPCGTTPAPPSPCGTTPAPSPPCGTTPAPPPPCGTTSAPPSPCGTTPAPPPPCGSTPSPNPPCGTTSAPSPLPCDKMPRPPPCSTTPTSKLPPCSTPTPSPSPCGTTPAQTQPPCTASVPRPPSSGASPAPKTPCGAAVPPPSSPPTPAKPKTSIFLEYENPVRIKIFSNEKKYLPASGNIFSGHNDEYEEQTYDHSYFFPSHEEIKKKDNGIEEKENQTEHTEVEEQEEEDPFTNQEDENLKYYEEEDERSANNEEENERSANTEGDESGINLSVIKNSHSPSLQKRRRLVTTKSVAYKNNNESEDAASDEKTFKIKKPKRKKWVRIVKKQRRKTNADSNPSENYQLYSSDNIQDGSSLSKKVFGKIAPEHSFHAFDIHPNFGSSGDQTNVNHTHVEMKKVTINDREVSPKHVIGKNISYRHLYPLKTENERQKKLEQAVERYVEDYVEKQLGEELLKNTGVPKTTIFSFEPKDGPKIQTITTTVAKSTRNGIPANFSPKFRPETKVYFGASQIEGNPRNARIAQRKNHDENIQEKVNISYESFATRS